MTKAELLNRMSSREISEWWAFYQLEPFGRDADFLGHAITAQTVANVHRTKDVPPYDIEDFMPTFGEKKPQTVAEMIQFARMTTIGLGGKDLTQDDDIEELE